MGIKVIRTGLLTSIQDLGRYGMQKHGVIVSGAMDPYALRVGNLLVGNEEREGALEITMLGPTLQFLEDSLIAICGGDLSPKIDGQKIPGWRPVLVKKGSILKFGEPVSGCRAYLTLAGGFDIPQVMGSQSTYLRAGIGGFQGRSLKKGDILNLRTPSEQANKIKHYLSKTTGTQLFSASKWSISNRLLSFYQKKTIIRVLPSNQFNCFTLDSRKNFFTKDFYITQQSDRMGYQLKGPQIKLSEPLELVSEAVSTGTVQIPPAGNPIILMADCQTTGGYPKMAQVINVDIPILAQIKPGEKIRFQMVTLEKSQELYRTREFEIQRLKLAIASKV